MGEGIADKYGSCTKIPRILKIKLPDGDNVIIGDCPGF